MIPNIFIADDHPIVIKGLNSILEEKKMRVVGTADNGRSALNFIIKNKPDIAVLDIDMPCLTGIEIAEICKKNNLHTKIVLMTFHKEVTYYLKAKDYNVYGYLLKEFAVEEIECCINSVQENIPYFSKKIKDFLGFTDESNEVLKNLSSKEQRILKLISQYKSNLEIGEILFMSHRTVEKHRSKIILKLNLERTTGVLSLWVQKNKHLFN